MKCQEFSSFLDDYLTGNMPDEIKERVEEHYFQCDNCYMELKLREGLAKKNFLVYLKAREKNRSWILKPILTFASFLIIFISTILIIQQHRHSRLLEEISEFSPPTYHQSETRKPSAASPFSRAMQYYEEKDYQKALKLIKKIEVDEVNPQTIFFTGITYLINKEYKNAILQFDAIITMMNPAYFDEATYFRAIALLRLNQKKAALEELEHLANMFSPFASRANALINKIKERL